MYKSLLITGILLFNVSVISQNSKKIQGTIFFKTTPIRDVEVINWNKKTITKSDEYGQFSILSSINDTLYFISKSHSDKQLYLYENEFVKTKIEVYMNEKTIDLEELKIIKNQNVGIKLKQQDFDGAVLERNARMPVNKAVYMGTIENGADLVKIGKLIISAFKKKKTDSVVSKIDFKRYVKYNIETGFFVKNLNLKPDQIEGFVAFCNEDVQAEKVIQNENIFEIMDFMVSKHASFKIASQ